MALFKPFRGNRASLNSVELHDGYAYFCIDDGTFHIDVVDSNGVLQRKQLNAKDAETLTGMSYDEIKAEIDNKSNKTHTHGEYVVTSRTVNGKSLSEDIDLSASDVGALPNDTTIPVIEESKTGTIELTWDGEIGSNDSFAWGTWTYYKVSNLTPKYSSVTDGHTFRSNGLYNDTIAEHVNCYAIGDALVVTAVGAGSKSGNQFVAPSTGIYFGRMSSWYTSEFELDCDIPYNSLTLSTSTGTQYKISTDDTKTIYVTNMDDDSVESMVKAPSTAAVGQAIVVAGIDGTGRPIEFDAVNMPSTEGLATEAYVDASLVSAKTYADNAATQVKSDLLNGAGKAYDTLKELGDLIDENTDAIDALETVAAGKADAEHTHDEYAKIADLDSVAFDGYVTKGAESGSTIGANATVEGVNNIASSKQAHAEGGYTRAGDLTIYSEFSGSYDSYGYEHAEGYSTLAKGNSAHAEGAYTQAISSMSHAEGLSTVASKTGAHAEGKNTTASGYNSHAEGSNTTSSGENTHAEGNGTTASLQAAHAEGYNTTASGYASHAEGLSTKASSAYQHVQGKYNIEDTASTYAHIVGNGTSDSKRSNAHTLDWNGNAWFKGSVYVGGTGQSSGTALASTMPVTTAEYNTMSANNELQETTLYMLTDDTEEEDLQATVNEMNNIDYEANLAFDVNEIV